MVLEYHAWYTCTYKNDLKYKHSDATGKLVGVVSIEDIAVYYGSNSTAMSAARISTTILASMWVCTRTMVVASFT